RDFLSPRPGATDVGVLGQIGRLGDCAMTRLRRGVACMAAVIMAAGAGIDHGRAQTAAPASDMPAALANAIDPLITTLWSGFDRAAALGHVEFVGQFWRLGGNAGYDATIDRMHARLIGSGFVDRE